jgi:hypothetical protein
MLTHGSHCRGCSTAVCTSTVFCTTQVCAEHLWPANCLALWQRMWRYQQGCGGACGFFTTFYPQHWCGWWWCGVGGGTVNATAMVMVLVVVVVVVLLLVECSCHGAVNPLCGGSHRVVRVVDAVHPPAPSRSSWHHSLVYEVWLRVLLSVASIECAYGKTWLVRNTDEPCCVLWAAKRLTWPAAVSQNSQYAVNTLEQQVNTLLAAISCEQKLQ